MKNLKFFAVFVLTAALTAVHAAEIDVNGKFVRNAKGSLTNWTTAGGLEVTSVKGASGVDIRKTAKETWGGLYGKKIELKKDEKAIITVNASGVGEMIFGATWYTAKGQWYRNDQIKGKLAAKAQDFKFETVRGKPGMPDAVMFTPTILLIGKNTVRINFVKVEVVKK